MLEDLVGTNSAAPEVVKVYTWGHALLSQDRFDGSGWSIRFYGGDGHHNVRYPTSSLGHVTDVYDYDAFGNLNHQSGSTPNNYLFAGEQYDPDLGLYYLRARYHNPDTGRFWSMDTYEGSAEDPASLHKYTFCGANPVNAYDPSGNVSLSEWMTTTAIGNLLSGALVNSYLSGFARLFGARYGAGSDWNTAGAIALDGVTTDAIEGGAGGLLGFGAGKFI